MAIDPSIPLAVDTQGLDVGKLMSGAQFALQMRQAQRQEQNQNALKSILSSPDAFDPKTSSLTPNALKQIMQVDPETGIKLQSDMLEQQMKRAQEHHYQSENGRMSFDAMTGIAGAAVDAYNDAKKNGAKEDDARAAAMRVRNEAAQNNGGLLSDSDVDKLTASPFDPQQAEAFAGLNKEWSTNRRGERQQNERERHDQEMEQHGDKMIGVALSRLGQSEDNKWEVLTDPKTNTQYRYNPTSGKATTLDGTSEYKPEGAAKLGGGATARSAASLAAQRYLQEHPDATAEDVAQFAADFGKTVKSVGAFSTGKQGDMVRSFNVAISHLNTLNNLVDGLGNGDVQLINKASNAFKQQFGAAAPTSFDAAKAIVGDEIIKAVVGGGGALADRENAQNQIDRAESPEQLKGVINTYKDLMAGQLKGLKKQYGDTTGRKDFDERLAPETKKELGISDSAKSLPQVKSSADYESLKSGTHYLDPDGKERVKK